MKQNSEKREAFEGKLKKAITPILFLLPFGVLFLLFVVFPFAFGITISFFKWNMFDSSRTSFVGFENYAKILFNRESIYNEYFWSGLGNTLLFVVISVPLLIVLPLVLAAILDKKPFGFRFFRVSLFAPTVLSVATIALIWAWQFYTHNGFINGILVKLGLPRVDWLNTQPWAWIALLVVTLWWTSGTNMVIFAAGMKNVDRNLYEAAELDGASAARKFWSITVPGIRHQLFMCLIMTMIASFNIYGQPQMLTNGGPVIEGVSTTRVLMMHIRGLITGANANPGVASAMSVCMGLIMICLSVVQNVVNKRMED